MSFLILTSEVCVHVAQSSGNSNTAVGKETLMNCSGSNAYRNSSFGALAGKSQTVGSECTLIGASAGREITTGIRNLCLGAYAGGSSSLTTGSDNIYVGRHTVASAVDVNFEYVIGNGITTETFVGGGTETIRIGVATDYITCDFGESNTWTHTSDVRIKKDIEDNQLGLSLINDLRPVTYKKKSPSEYPEEFSAYDAKRTGRKNPDKKHYGFIAQEVKESMDKAGHSEFPVWKENPDGMQELGETEFITPLIKAVQELSAQVDKLNAELSALKGE